MTSEAPANLITDYANIRRDPLVTAAQGWTPNTNYALCQDEYSPLGALLHRKSAGASGAAFTAGEAGNWAPAHTAGRTFDKWGLNFTGRWQRDKVYVQGDVVRHPRPTDLGQTADELQYVMRCPVLLSADFEAEVARHDFVTVADFRANRYPPPLIADPCAAGSTAAGTPHPGEAYTQAQVDTAQALLDALAAAPPGASYRIAKDAMGVLSVTTAPSTAGLWTFLADFTTVANATAGSTAAAPGEGDQLVHATERGWGAWTYANGDWRNTEPPTVLDFPALQNLNPVGRKLPVGTRIAVLDDRGNGSAFYLCFGTTPGAPCTDVIPA